MDEDLLFDHLENLEKQDLLSFLRQSFEELPIEARWGVFGKCYNQLKPKKVDGQMLFNAIQKFDQETREGQYYQEIVTTYKNYDQVPEVTNRWYDRMSLLLGKTVHLTHQKEYQIAYDCFQILNKLMDDALMGDEYIFDRESGSWKLTPSGNVWEEAMAIAERNCKPNS